MAGNANTFYYKEKLSNPISLRYCTIYKHSNEIQFWLIWKAISALLSYCSTTAVVSPHSEQEIIRKHDRKHQRRSSSQFERGQLECIGIYLICEVLEYIEVSLKRLGEQHCIGLYLQFNRNSIAIAHINIRRSQDSVVFTVAKPDKMVWKGDLVASPRQTKWRLHTQRDGKILVSYKC